MAPSISPNSDTTTNSPETLRCRRLRSGGNGLQRGFLLRDDQKRAATSKPKSVVVGGTTTTATATSTKSPLFNRNASSKVTTTTKKKTGWNKGFLMSTSSSSKHTKSNSALLEKDSTPVMSSVKDGATVISTTEEDATNGKTNAITKNALLRPTQCVPTIHDSRSNIVPASDAEANDGVDAVDVLKNHNLPSIFKTFVVDHGKSNGGGDDDEPLLWEANVSPSTLTHKGESSATDHIKEEHTSDSQPNDETLNLLEFQQLLENVLLQQQPPDDGKYNPSTERTQQQIFDDLVSQWNEPQVHCAWEHILRLFGSSSISASSFKNESINSLEESLFRIHPKALTAILQRVDTQDERKVALLGVHFLRERYGSQDSFCTSRKTYIDTVNAATDAKTIELFMQPLLALALQSQRTMLAQSAWEGSILLHSCKIRERINFEKEQIVTADLDAVKRNLLLLLEQQIQWQQSKRKIKQDRIEYFQQMKLKIEEVSESSCTNFTTWLEITNDLEANVTVSFKSTGDARLSAPKSSARLRNQRFNPTVGRHVGAMTTCLLLIFLLSALDSMVDGLVVSSKQPTQLWHLLRKIHHPETRQNPFSTFHRIASSPLPARTAPTSTALPLSPMGVASSIQSLHGNPSYVLTAILWLSAFGTSLERSTLIGKALSAPLATMALALAVANVGVIPFQSPIYAMVNRFIVPLAVPLLLFDSDLKRVVRDTGTLLAAFGVGALATIVGTLVAYPLIPLKSLGRDVGWRIACALAARHIGGAINFVAVAETLNIGGNAVAAAIAADNVVVALYFTFLFSIALPGEEEAKGSATLSIDPSVENAETALINTIGEMELEDESSSSSITLSSLAVSLAVASAIVTSGSLLTKLILPVGVSSLPLISTLTVLAATAFPDFFAGLSKTGTALGVIFIQMFFACSGAAGSIRLVFEQAPALFAFSALQIGVHFGVLMGIGRGIFRLPNRELYLASNANVGGPTTAAAMAQAKKWKKLVLPALLIGILGYATATALALGLGPLLVRLPLLR